MADVMRDGGDGEEGRTVGATLRWRNVGAVARWVNTLCGGVRVQCGASCARWEIRVAGVRIETRTKRRFASRCCDGIVVICIHPHCKGTVMQIDRTQTHGDSGAKWRGCGTRRTGVRDVVFCIGACGLVPFCYSAGNREGRDYTALIISDAFVPPNPNELDRTVLTGFSLAVRGTRSMPSHPSDGLCRFSVGGNVPVCIAFVA